MSRKQKQAFSSAPVEKRRQCGVFRDPGIISTKGIKLYNFYHQNNLHFTDQALQVCS